MSDAGLLLHPAMSATRADDLDWLDRLISAMKLGASREEVVAFLGDDAGPLTDGTDGRSVRPRSKLLAEASVYRLPHIEEPVVVDITFSRAGMPALEAVTKHVGALRPVAPAPDDFASGPKLVHYVESPSTKIEVRVFVELDGVTRRVAKLNVHVGPMA
jgi:hypothetical protein